MNTLLRLTARLVVLLADEVSRQRDAASRARREAERAREAAYKASPPAAPPSGPVTREEAARWAELARREAER